MNDNGVQQESEFVFRRLTETLKIYGLHKEVNGHWWLLILGVVLFVGVALVLFMYRKDARTVRWYWATPLALLRISVYACLALMFLMPARQDYDRVEKQSRVLVLIDVSDSMAQISDEVSSKPVTRLSKVLDFMSDDRVAFVNKLLDKNPVFVYRFGNRLDEEPQQFEKSSTDPVPVYRLPDAEGALNRMNGRPWGKAEWQAYGYDFKPWIIRGLSDDAAAAVKANAAWEGDKPGNAEWAQKWLDKKEDAYPSGLTPADKAVLLYNRDKLPARVELARSLGSATNVPDSTLALINKEAGNMVEGIIVFSDGQSNLGNEAVLADLRARATAERIPVFTVGIGSEQKTINVRITDLQAPELTPPDESFKVIIEQDGDGLVGQKAKIELEVQPPKSDATIRVPAEAVYQPGEPPHAQAEIVLDPEKAPELLKSKENPKAFVEGEWRVRAVTPRVEGERYQDKEHVGEWTVVKVQRKPQRVLVMCSAPNRDFQFLITQLLRDKADLSVFVQNEAGTAGKINLLEDGERQLQHFPDRIRVEESPTETPAEKWYNIARYDVIIAFDIDWTQLTTEQIDMLRTWVELQAGGLLFMAGHIHTKHLARPDAGDKFQALNTILPVVPGDPDLAAAKRTADKPWRLEFENLGGDLDFMKIDDSIPNIETGWERFFTGRDEKDEKARVLRGFYNYFPIRELKPVATPVARFPDPNAIKMPDGKAPPWMATMQYGQGKTMWIGSPEIWRLRQFRDDYFERFWTKLIRYMGSGSRRKQTQRGRILMTKEVPVGGYIRVTSQLLDPSLGFMPANSDPKISFKPVELDKYPPEIEKLQGENQIAAAKAKYHAKYSYEYRMNAKKGAEAWQGYFQRSQLASSEKFPTGIWRAEVEIPSSAETLKQKFNIRQSNPELDVTRPDFNALYRMATPVSEIVGRLPDETLVASLQKATAGGPEGKRLAFKFGDEESLKLIPDCIKQDAKTIRNKGKVDDYWDKGFALPSWMTTWLTGPTDRPMRVGYMLLLCGTLLSVEWLTRKLLKLA
ncbi:vWA domain-containing protein [Zavarzinella formosa]|uniref:VWA domain-containing protein n=1 Tax=Zavarzinella formosa TaxID=360055 RepID=UPI0002F7951C|nr:VWA domain-containing protein [Zavarzinella formosa]